MRKRRIALFHAEIWLPAVTPNTGSKSLLGNELQLITQRHGRAENRQDESPLGGIQRL